ncbi:MAG TPA: hypothetical protein VGE40_02820 [Bacilli bacterium]
MQFESRYLVPTEIPEKSGDPSEFIYIKPGAEISTIFRLDDPVTIDPKKYKYRIRMTGEVDIHPSWRWELGFPLLYRLIDDALCSEVTRRSHYSLKLTSRGDDYPRRVYYKIAWPPRISSQFELRYDDQQCWKLGMWIKKEDIRLLPGGRLDLVIEVYLKKEGSNPADISGSPDHIFSVDPGDGTCSWEEKGITLPLIKDIGCLLIYFTAEHFSGTMWIEEPYLANSSADNLLPPFYPANPYHTDMNWLGYNLSKKEWPEFHIEVNGGIACSGEQFQRIYRWPVNEIELPPDLLKTGDNELKIKLTSSYREALPYKLKSLEMLIVPEDSITIVSCPKIVVAGKDFTILVSVNQPGLRIEVETGSRNIEALERVIVFVETGLHVIKFKAISICGSVDIRIKTGIEEFYCCIDRAVVRPDDDVVTGTGDSIYINQNIKDMEYFLSWYLHHQLGNSITFRPVYRWSGSRVLRKEVWDRVKELCCKMELFYCLMTDGRELPGSGANPGKEMMESSYYMGNQFHELDGTYYYWGSKQMERGEDKYHDVFWKLADRAKDSGCSPPLYTEQGNYLYFSPYSAANMKEGALNFIESVRKMANNGIRHTGPSTLFKYFYQAGVEWLGAELMYGPQEVLLSALRGASAAYGKNNYGAHLAVQWSTTPHDTEQRYRRYFLALAISYLHGAKQINTEEGLWRLEEYYSAYERFDEPCIRHREIQQKFYHFVQTHSRRGNIHVPMAFVHGNYDGWVCFTRNNVWAQDGVEWNFNHPEESWDLLNVFYPNSLLDAIYRHPCPNHPQGYYSGTPYGVVDILPIEADGEVMGKYNVLAFLGWNTAEELQIEKLKHFVINGGVLLLGWVHLQTGAEREKAFGNTPEMLGNDVIGSLIGAELIEFMAALIENNMEATVGRLRLKGASPVIQNEEGIPVLLENKLGKGKVLFLNVKAYPSEKSVRNLYEHILHQLGRDVVNTERERGWLQCTAEVGFTVYDREGEQLRTIYFINTNWWDETAIPSSIQLVWGEREIPIDVYRGEVNILTLSDNWAVWTFDNDTDVISVHEGEGGASFKLQGMGQTELMIFHKGGDDEVHIYVAGSDNAILCKEHKYTNVWKIAINLDETRILNIRKLFV